MAMIRILFLLFLGMMISCSKESYEADIPSYLYISSIDLQTDASEGSGYSNFTDAWVTMDGKFLGVFELPATVPILAEGVHNFHIYPGIKVNGVSATRIRHPFLEVCDVWIHEDDDTNTSSSKISLHRDSVVHIKAVTRYSSSTTFTLIEGFEEEDLMVSSQISDTNFVHVKSDDIVYEGASSAAVFLDEVNSFFEIRSSNFTTLPIEGTSSMLELNYRCDHPFRVGVLIKSSEADTFRRFSPYYIKPSTVWNKIYLDMTDPIHTESASYEHGVFINANMSESSESASFYFDNIKWLHRNNE